MQQPVVVFRKRLTDGLDEEFYIDIEAGIYDQKFLTKMGKIRLTGDVGAQLKWKQIEVLIKKYNIKPTQVWFYDDNWMNIDEVRSHGVNSVEVDNSQGKKNCCLTPKELNKLVKVAKKDPNNVRLVLFDWDYTFATVDFGYDCKLKPLQWVVEECFGGKERLDKLLTSISELESLGVKIGFITYNSKIAITSVLHELGWISDQTAENLVPITDYKGMWKQVSIPVSIMFRNTILKHLRSFRDAWQLETGIYQDLSDKRLKEESTKFLRNILKRFYSNEMKQLASIHLRKEMVEEEYPA